MTADPATGGGRRRAAAAVSAAWRRRRCGTPRRALALTAAYAALLLPSVLSATGAQAAALGHRLTIYSVAEQEEFINHEDDRIRGSGRNPFGNFRDVAPSTSTAAGPFPGDEALFSFNLYASSGLGKRIGTAVYTCMYNFNKNAFCDATFRFTGGSTLVAEGSFNFNTTAFGLAVTGGDGTYAGASGTLNESPAANHAQRLVFILA
jgi:hypothetical protein